MTAARAALLRAVNEPFSVEDIEMLPLHEHRVLVKTHASPFCSTDVMNWEGRLGKVPPTVLGHASIGEVVEIGSAVTRVRVGQRVVVPGTPECGTCYFCSIGEPWQCGELFDLRGVYPEVARTHDGLPVNAAGCVGAYAALMSISENQAFPIESDVPSDVLSMLGCGVSTGVGSVVNVAQLQPGESLAIFGAGHIGLWALQAAKLAQAGPVIVVDADADRRHRAEAIGADIVVDPGTADPVESVLSATSGRGADCTLEAAGPTDAQRDAVRAVRRGGRTVLTGVVDGAHEVSFPQAHLAIQSRRLLSSQNGQLRMRSELPRLAKLLENGALDPEQILTRRYDLDELDLARENSRNHVDVTGVITFGH